MEGWKRKNLDQKAGNPTSSASSQQAEQSAQDEEEERLRNEAELSLAEKDTKRKAGVQDGRKAKKWKLAKVAGWGLATCKEEGKDQEEPTIGRMEDWTASKEILKQNLK